MSNKIPREICADFKVVVGLRIQIVFPNLVRPLPSEYIVSFIFSQIFCLLLCIIFVILNQWKNILNHGCNGSTL